MLAGILITAALAALAEPAVSARDMERFPVEMAAERGYELASKHRDWLELQVQFHPGYEAAWKAFHRDACWRADCWENLMWAIKDARDCPSMMEYRLTALRRLLGCTAYHSGWMPPPVSLASSERD